MPFTYHRQCLTNGIDLANSTGIEIGPLVNPMVRPHESNVHYVDRASTEELKEWYAKDPSINVDNIMPISYVWGEQSLAEATGDTEQFDYCIASHVIEHIPDLITWLAEIASILKSGGLACFAVPDKHYTFDYLRPATTLADLVDSHIKKLRKPSPRHIFDHFANFTDVNVMDCWSPHFDGNALVRKNTKERIWGVCKDAIEHDKYIDSHCSVFTFDSFFELLEGIAEIGLLDFKVKKVFQTKRGMFEFFVQLEKLDTNLDRHTKLEAFQQSRLKGDFFEVEMIADTPCVAKIYYDNGQSFCEADSVEVHYRQANQTQLLRFPLPKQGIKHIRFDPADHELTITIKRISFAHDSERTEVSLASLQVGSQFAQTDITNGVLHAKSEPNASDPYFVISA